MDLYCVRLLQIFRQNAQNRAFFIRLPPSLVPTVWRKKARWSDCSNARDLWKSFEGNRQCTNYTKLEVKQFSSFYTSQVTGFWVILTNHIPPPRRLFCNKHEKSLILNQIFDNIYSKQIVLDLGVTIPVCMRRGDKFMPYCFNGWLERT